MEKEQFTEQELERISRIEMEKEQREHYQERPVVQRIFALILAGVVVLGIGLFCYWLVNA